MQLIYNYGRIILPTQIFANMYMKFCCRRKLYCQILQVTFSEIIKQLLKFVNNTDTCTLHENYILNK